MRIRSRRSSLANDRQRNPNALDHSRLRSFFGKEKETIVISHIMVFMLTRP
ncbi:hypothetical protein EV281_1106 [Rhizobium sp. BK418]|nr:hypothetical protein EV281_1106 [Rhizobium sp. BK418]